MMRLSEKRQFIYKLLPFLILILSGLLRFVYLSKVPGGMDRDETFVAWNALALLKDGMDSSGNHFPIYLADWGDGHSALYSWILIPIFALNKGKFHPFLSRLPQAVIAVLTVWTVYCLFKRMFGKTAGLWAEFLLAICPWHVMMSRWGLDANLAPGFLIFGLYFFIRGLEDKRFLILTALVYGLSLYCYALIWPIVPVMLLLQIIYGAYHKKLTFNRWSIGSGILLFIMAVPLLLFILVNSGKIQPIELGFMTIPAMNGYRGGEIAWKLSDMWSNFRRVGTLLYRQDLGSPIDILLPYGLFYDIGRVFIVLGFVTLVRNMFFRILKKEFSYEYFVFVQLIGGGIVALLVWVNLHQVNCLFIPLVLCEAYGVWKVTQTVSRLIRQKWVAAAFITLIIAFFMVNLALFQRAYYTNYREVVDSHFGKGIKEAVEFAMNQSEKTGIESGRYPDIITEKGLQFPRLLLFSEITPSEYLENVVYRVPPAPASFRKDEITFRIGIDYDSIQKDDIYIIYFNDVETFEPDFELTQFREWYVAVPRQ